MELNLRPREECTFDAVSLGEVMLRLDPGEGRIRTARSFRAWEGGGEYNVIRGLHKCFGLNTAVITAFADNEVGKLMREQMSGRIINTASIGGRFASEGNIAYYASKGAVINFTRGLAADMAPYNVTVNAIAPGVFDTELTHESLSSPLGQGSLARLPLKRFGKDGDMDGILIYFASDASAYCTGQTIYIDGGLTMLL